MNREEFSNEFDVQVNSYKRLKDFDKQEFLDSIEFNEYEKSLFLTKAQEELIISLYTGKNTFGESFESTEEMRRYLSNLVVTEELTPITTTSGAILGIESNSKFFTLPEDLMFITYEAVKYSGGKCEGSHTMKVVPVRQDEYQSIKDNPFRGTNNRRAFRLDLSDGVIEILCKYLVSKYLIRYIRKAEPIILEDLPNHLTVDNKNTESGCELHEALHQKILERAVVLALQSKGYNFNQKENK